MPTRSVHADFESPGGKAATRLGPAMQPLMIALQLGLLGPA